MMIELCVGAGKCLVKPSPEDDEESIVVAVIK